MDSSWQSILCLIVFIIWIPLFTCMLILYYRNFNHIVLKWRLPVLTIAFAIATFFLDIVHLSNEIIIRQLGYYPCLFQTIASAAFPATLSLAAFKGNLLALNYNAEYRKRSRLAILLRPKVLNYALVFIFLFTCFWSAVLFIINNNSRNIYGRRECHYEYEESLWITIGTYALGFPYILVTGIHIIRVRDRWSIGPESIIGIVPMALTAALYMLLTCYYRFTDQLQLRYDVENTGMGFALIFTFSSISGQALIIGRPLYIIYFRKKARVYNNTAISMQRPNNVKAIIKSDIDQTKIKINSITSPLTSTANTRLIKVEPAINNSIKNSHHTLQLNSINTDNVTNNMNGPISPKVLYNNFADTSRAVVSVSKRSKLQIILSRPELLKQLEIHAQKSFSSELIMFIIEAERLIRDRDIINNNDNNDNNNNDNNNINKVDIRMNDNEWLDRVRVLYETYIVENCRLEINISGSAKTEFSQAFNDNRLKNNYMHFVSLLLSAHSEVCALVETNLLYSFLKDHNIDD